MADKKYNGYRNYDTWLLCLNIDNDEGLYNKFRNYKGSPDDLKDELEEMFYNEEMNVVKIFDTWDMRSWHNIDWIEVLETRKED